MELTELVGLYLLSGAEPGYTPEKGFYGGEPTLSFILDGKTYTATENPDDGYRSYLRDVREGGECNNTFEGEEVNIEYIEGDGYFTGIKATVVATGQEVLRIGTNNYDDYYPCCVLEFTPQALAANQ